MKVRTADPSDLEQLVHFIAEEAREAEGREIDRATLVRGIAPALVDPSIAAYWVLTDEKDVPCGNVSVVKEWSEWNARYYWWIQSIYIHPAQRGRGYMTLMLDAVIKEARKQDCHELRLYVHEANMAAIKAYEKSFFRQSPYRIMIRDIAPTCSASNGAPLGEERPA